MAKKTGQTTGKKDYKLWEEISFGRFRQGTADTKRKLEWYVIGINQNQMTLLCAKVIRSLPYNEIKTNVTWETCSLRKYLNEQFFESTFSQEEKEAIIEMPLEPALGKGTNLKQCRRTRDRVFLADIDLVETLPNNIRLGYPTLRTVEENRLFMGRGLSTKDYIYWWVRNPGKTNLSAQLMGGYGFTRQSVDTQTGGVRPVIVVNLNSSLFGGNYEEIEIPEVFTEEEQQNEKGKNRRGSLKELQSSHEEELKLLTDRIRADYAEHMAASLKEIKNRYQDLADTIEKIGTDYFDTDGKTAKEYFKSIGLLFDADSADLAELTAFLLDRCAGSPKPRTISGLKSSYPELGKQILRLEQQCSSVYKIDPTSYLQCAGLIRTSADEERHMLNKEEEKALLQAEKESEKARERAEYLQRSVEQIPVTNEKQLKKLENLFNRLEQYYPEHAVFALDSLNENMRDRASAIAKEIGYKNYNDMLNAYGWRVLKGEEVREIRPEVIYGPGNEPDFLKTRISNTIKSLNEYYPDHIIKRGLQAEHKSLASTISGMSQWLGYENTTEFLKAYGFSYQIMEKGGRPKTNDHEKIIQELKNKTKNSPYKSMTALLSDNPELSGPMKTISNSSRSLFGMTLNNYLKSEGILAGGNKNTNTDDTQSSESESSVNGSADLAAAARVAEKAGLLTETPDANVDGSRPIIREILNRYKEKSQKQPEIDTANKKDKTPDYKLVGNSVIALENVSQLDPKELKQFGTFEKIIIQNPRCMITGEIHGKLLNDFSVEYDITDKTEQYLTSCKDHIKERRMFIGLFVHCIEYIGKTPEEIWADDSYRLILLTGLYAWKTNIAPIGNDMEIIDDILTTFFGLNKVIGLYKYNPNHSEYKNKEISWESDNGGDLK